MNAPGDVMSRVQVRTLFAMAQDKWVRDFLLESSPLEDARILTAPVQRFHSISGEHEFKVDKHTGEPRKRSRWLLIPAFNNPPRAAGLFIQQRDDAMHFVRFVRDDDSGDVLYITDIPDADCTEVMYNRQTNSTTRQSCYLRFGTAQFRHAFDASLSDAAVNVLTEALLTSCQISESRMCPRCGSPPFMTCPCDLPFRRAEHAMDFRFYGTNTSNMFGTYCGKMLLSTYNLGQERSCQAYGVENATRIASESITEQLLTWAVQARLKLLAMNTTACTVPAKKTRRSDRLLPPADRYGEQEEGLTPDGWLLCELVDNLMEGECFSGISSSPVGGDDKGSPSADDILAMDVLDFEDITNFSVDSPESVVVIDHAVRAGRSPRSIAAPPLLLPRRGPETEAGQHQLDAEMIRKIKKREAADRSNHKRHLKHKKLKAELATAKHHLEKLRKREEDLKAEKVALLKQLETLGE